ncbi:MAG: DUF447 family protein [Euryarchaeota archaeon]|nr:DUF447 family protein [Euryarchaeota archaeon]
MDESMNQEGFLAIHCGDDVKNVENQLLNVTRIDPGDFGILNGISEVIATTRSESGVPNAAPIGIIRNNRSHGGHGTHRNGGDQICVRLFSGSHTRQNVIETGEIVANIIHDPIIYVESTFDDLDPDMFKYPDNGGCPTLKHADAWLLFVCEQSKGNLFELTPVTGVICNTPMICVNRGFNSVIESLVHATRYQLKRDPKYLDLIRHHEQIIRICGGTREKEAIIKLKEIIEGLL